MKSRRLPGAFGEQLRLAKMSTLTPHDVFSGLVEWVTVDQRRINWYCYKGLFLPFQLVQTAFGRYEYHFW